MHCAKKCGLFLLAALVFTFVCSLLGLGYVRDWLSAADRPEKADAILVLGGGFSRPFEAADLYRQGLAPKVYVSAVKRDPQYRLLDQAGIPFPREEDIVRQVLIKKGVPAGAIALFGKGSISTADEAQAARAIFGGRRAKLLVVSSPYHLRRARIIFTDALPTADIRMIATSYDPFPASWWKDQDSARNVLLELAKIVFYELGGRY